MDKSYPLWFKSTIIVVGMFTFFALLAYGKFILMPLAISSLIAMLLDPVSRWLERHKINRAIAILISMFLLSLILGGIISLLSIQLVQFANHLPEANEKIQQVGSNIIHFFELKFNLTPNRQVEFLQRGLTTLVNKSGQYVTTALSATTNVFTTLSILPFFVFFMMYYKDRYRIFLHNAFAEKNKSIDKVIDSIQTITQNYIIGVITVIFILSILNTVGLWIVGIKHAIFFGTFAGILAIIPYIGVIIGSLPAIIFSLLFTNSLWNPVAVMAVFFIVQLLEGNLITPNIVGSRVSINPFMALVALVLGGQLWGVTGMVIFVPFLGIVKCIFDHVDVLKPYGYLFGNTREY